MRPAHERVQQSVDTEQDAPIGRQLVHAQAPPPVTARHAAPEVHPRAQSPQRQAWLLEVPQEFSSTPIAQRDPAQQPPLQRQSKEHVVVHCPVALHAWPTGQSLPTLLRQRVPVSTGGPASGRAATQCPRSHAYPLRPQSAVDEHSLRQT